MKKNEDLVFNSGIFLKITIILENDWQSLISFLIQCEALFLNVNTNISILKETLEKLVLPGERSRD